MNIFKSKNTILAIILLGGLSSIFSVNALASPEENTTTYNAQTEQYAMVNAIGKLLSLTKWKVEVDFGQALEIGIKNKDLLRDKDGKTIDFNSPVDAINYLNSKGWVVISANSDGEQFVAIMKRTVEK